MSDLSKRGKKKTKRMWVIVYRVAEDLWDIQGDLFDSYRDARENAQPDDTIIAIEVPR